MSEIRKESNEAMNREIIEIRSVEGDYFVIGKNARGFYLKNRYTEVPNEFAHIPIGGDTRRITAARPKEMVWDYEKDVEIMFRVLCQRVEEAWQVAAGMSETQVKEQRDKSRCVKVIFADKTERLCRDFNHRLNTYTIARFSDFSVNLFDGVESDEIREKNADIWGNSFERSDIITLDRIRRACEDKVENYEMFLRAVRDYEEDDYTDIKETVAEDGSISLDYYCYCQCLGEGFITLDAEGNIGAPGIFRWIKVLKENGVKVRRM